MTDSSKIKTTKDRANLWHERVSIAKQSCEDWAENSGAKRFLKEYKGDYGITFKTRTASVQVPAINEVFAYVQADVATTYNRDPYITVNAKSGTTQGAALWEVILNYYWRELQTKEEIEYEIIEKDLVGFAWHKVGYAVDSYIEQDQLKIKNENLYSNYLCWKDVVWNIGATRVPKDCQWMAQRIIRPIAQIKKRFPQAKGLEGVPTPDIDDAMYKKSMYKDDIKVGVLWEIWDKEEKKVYLIAEGLKDKFLEEKPWPDYLEELPFLMYWDFAIPGSPRPMSAIAPWEKQILEEMVILASAVNHVKRWNRQAFVKNGTIDENALDKFEQGIDGSIINFNGDTADIRFADYGPLPADFYMIMDRLQAIKRNINGQPEFVRGGVTKTNTRTIGELNLMQMGNRSRQDRKIDRLETHLENIARHMMAHLKANFDFEQTVKITGETPESIIEALGQNFNPETQTVTFTPDDIKGDYDVDIKVGSTLPLDRQGRMQTLEIILQTLAGVAAEGVVSPLVITTIEELLKEYDIKSLREAYAQEIAMKEQEQQMESQEQDVLEQKTLAEARKREAQANQIEVDTEISLQEAEVGPFGRAELKSLEKPQREPALR